MKIGDFQGLTFKHQRDEQEGLYKAKNKSLVLSMEKILPQWDPELGRYRTRKIDFDLPDEIHFDFPDGFFPFVRPKVSILIGENIDPDYMPTKKFEDTEFNIFTGEIDYYTPITDGNLITKDPVEYYVSILREYGLTERESLLYKMARAWVGNHGVPPEMLDKLDQAAKGYAAAQTIIGTGGEPTLGDLTKLPWTN